MGEREAKLMAMLVGFFEGVFSRGLKRVVDWASLEGSLRISDADSR